MGIEHPYLAILAVIAFTTAVMSVMYFFIHTYSEILKTPMLSTYAEACYTDSNVHLNITLKHERGLPVVLQRIEIYSDNGKIICIPTEEGLTCGDSSDIDAGLEGFSYRLGVGQIGIAKITFPQGYFTVGKTYHGLVFFDIGNTLFTFQLLKCPSITAPQPILRAKLVDIGVVAGNGTITVLDTVTISYRTASIDKDPHIQGNILYNDTFDTYPFTPGRLKKLTCNWLYDSTNKYIYIESSQQPNSYGGECIVVVDKSLPSSGTVYIASKITAYNKNSRGYVDMVLVQSTSALYTLGIYFHPGEPHRGYWIRRYVEEWQNLNNTPNRDLEYNVEYSIVSAYTFIEGLLKLFNGTFWLTATDSVVTPVQAGLGIYPEHSVRLLGASFDNLVVTVNARPWLVNVTGVPSGWRVVLKNSTGGVIDSVVSDGDTVSLNVWNYFIVPSGSIEIYDEQNVLVANKTFDYIVGGEVYEVNVYEYSEEFTGLLIGVGGSSEILVYNISGGVESPVPKYKIYSGTVFNGDADIAVGSGYIYLLNASGVFRYNFKENVWDLVIDQCRASGIGARLEVVGDVLVVIPGIGSDALCLYNMVAGNIFLHPIAEGIATNYISTATNANSLYVSLYDASRSRSIVVVYKINDDIVSVEDQYNITGYRLVGLAYDGANHLYFIHEYGGVYEFDITAKTLEILPIILPFTPQGYGDRLEYYDKHLIFVRGDYTSELYIIQLAI